LKSVEQMKSNHRKTLLSDSISVPLVAAPWLWPQSLISRWMEVFNRPPSRFVFGVASSWFLGLTGMAETQGKDATVISPDFLDQAVGEDQTLRFTLPDGRQIIGKIDQIERSSGGVAKVQGQVQHPEPGEFSFTRQQHDGKPGGLEGGLKFTSKPTEWKIEPEAGEYKFKESPVADAFRPRAMQMPTADHVRRQPGMSREEAEAALQKDLKIEKTADGKLRLGVVELDKEARAIRFPATVNMTSGKVEYALVMTTGKIHESMFVTSASPRDIHLGMLLLGIQPAKFALNADGGLLVPATAAVEVSVGWETNGPPVTKTLAELTNVADPSADKPATPGDVDRPWLYNGSRFSAAGFAAMLEGSIISLIADEMALVNNSRSDRENDEIHLPNTAVLPRAGTAVTITFRPSAPSSTPKIKP
jgi:hypothetical protein